MHTYYAYMYVDTDAVPLVEKVLALPTKDLYQLIIDTHCYRFKPVVYGSSLVGSFQCFLACNVESRDEATMNGGGRGGEKR